MFSTIISTDLSVKSYKLDIGAQYTQDFGKKHALTLGAVFSPGHNLSADAIEYRQTGTDANATVSQTPIEGNFGIPTTWGLGLAYVYDKRLTVAIDGMLQNWDDVSYEGHKDMFSKRAKLSLGAEFIPNPIGRNYLARIQYRVGGYYSKPYYKIDGLRAAKEYGVSFGFGLPVPRTRSMVSVSGQYVRTQGSRANFLDENTLRLCIGITFNERWFFKRKVD